MAKSSAFSSVSHDRMPARRAAVIASRRDAERTPYQVACVDGVFVYVIARAKFNAGLLLLDMPHGLVWHRAADVAPTI